jgi:outer membrane receptor for ferrienterochelin and colicin
MSDILELRMKVQSGNVLLRKHWSYRKKEKKLWALLIRNQMRLKKTKKAEQKKYTIMIISYRKRLLDPDNLVSGIKNLLDSCVDEELIYDDAPDYIDLKVEQYKSAREEHTMIIRK